MRRIRFTVSRRAEYPPDAAVELYGDLGSGVVDYDRPLPPGRVELWPVAAGRSGHLVDGHLMGWHADGRGADGHLEGTHLDDGHLAPARVVTLESPRYVFGRFRHVVRRLDGAGNPVEGGAEEYVETINDSPAAPGGLRLVGWEAATRRLVLGFEPVRFEAVAGS